MAREKLNEVDTVNSMLDLDGFCLLYYSMLFVDHIRSILIYKYYTPYKCG